MKCRQRVFSFYDAFKHQENMKQFT